MKRFSLFLLVLVWFNLLHAQQTTLEEGFESWPPVNWEFYFIGDATDGWRDDFEGIAHSGNQSAYSSIDNSQCDNWMVTPAVLINSADYELSFWEYHDATEFYDKLSVWISTGSSDPQDGDYVEVFETPQPFTEEIWEERTIDLSSYNGSTIHVAWRYEGTWHEYYLDDVSITPSSFTDAGLTAIINPTGVSETPGSEDLIVNVVNNGDNTINNITINWTVNGDAQTAFNTTNLNLAAGNSTQVNVGSYNYAAIGDYNLSATISTPGDFDPSNNTITGSYTIADQQDGAITQINPEGMIPSAGTYTARALVANQGANVINDLDINWNVDGNSQTPVSQTGLNIQPGESVWIDLGTYAFSSGISTITATAVILGDTDNSNNTKSVNVAVDTFVESFEGAQFPPNNWEVVFGIRDQGFETPVDGDFYYVAQPDSNIFGTVFDTIYSPRLFIETGDTYTINLKPSSFLAATHTVVAKNQETGEITLVQNLNPTPDVWQEITIDLSSVTGVYQIGITSTVNDFPGSTAFDLFSSTASLHLFDNDLSIEEGDLYFLAGDGQSRGYTARIKNEGALAVNGSDYTVRLMEGATVLASVSGVDLASWEETDITIDHTLSGLGQRRLHIEIDYAQDDYTGNNSFRETTVTVVPAGFVLNEIGTIDYNNLNFPFTSNGNSNSLGEDDLSQTIYKAEEFTSNGLVYGIIYSYYNLLEADYVQKLPLRVGIAQTQDTDLANGWLPQEEFTVLFDGVVEILPGFDHELFIPFSEPVPVTGLSNLVIQNFQFDPEWPPSILRFNSSVNNGGETRSISAIDVFDLDPETIDFWNPFPDFPHTQFVMTVEENTSILSGTVTDEVGTPLEDALVEVMGTGVEVTTDVNGDYAFPGLPYGTYTVMASRFGYVDNTLEVDMNTATTQQDIVLQQRPIITVSGRVVGSNDPSQPLEGVTIDLSGYSTDATTTAADGTFSFNTVYGFADYQADFFLYGYEINNVDIETVDGAIDLGDVVLTQEFLPAFDVVATDDGAVVVNWNNPIESAKVKVQNDFNEISNSYTNEPNEEVWLGNYFSIDQLTTITSVEIQTEIFPLNADFVTVDIFDRATDQIIASSEPFVITEASVIQVDVPNIVVTDDIAVAVHWQNNPESTNALAIDFSDPGIENTAMIKYPGEASQLLTDFFGGGPNSAFHVRLNTVITSDPVNNGEVLTYNVWRGLASEFPDTTNWEVINDSPVSGTTYTDMEWDEQTQPGETYRFAVEVIYSEGNSELTFSNTLDTEILSTADIQTDDLRLYPVPASELLYLQMGSGQSAQGITVYDLLGRVVYQLSELPAGQQRTTIDVSAWSSGMYIMQIETTNGSVQRKFMVN